MAVSAILFGISGMIFTIFKGSIVGIDVLKVFSGICLSLLICIVFFSEAWIRNNEIYRGEITIFLFDSSKYIIGIRGNRRNTGVSVFYMVLALTFLIVIGSASMNW